MEDLDHLRQEIDRLDLTLIKTLAERFSTVGKIGKIKKLQNQPSLDPARWQKVLETRLDWAKASGVDQNFIKKLLDLIHAQALTIEDHEK